MGDLLTFVATFRKEVNASRAREALNGAEFKGCKITASFRALELSRSSTKAGRLIVRNLSFSATAKHVRKTFEPLGTVSDVHLPHHPGKDGQHRGFAFVQYEELQSAHRAVSELNGSKICGRGVAVDWAVDAQLFSSLQREDQQSAKRKRPPESAKAEKDDESATEDEDEEDDENDEDEEDDEDDEEDEEDEEEEEEEEDEEDKKDED